EPTIAAVMITKAVVDVVGLASLQTLLPGFGNPIPVVRMDEFLPGCRLDIFRGDAGEFRPPSIEIIVPSIRIRAPAYLGYGFRQKVEPKIALFEGGRHLALLSCVNHNTCELDNPSPVVADRAPGNNKPAGVPFAGYCAIVTAIIRTRHDCGTQTLKDPV